MQEHINSSTVKIPRNAIQEIFNKAVTLAKTLEPLLSKDKKGFLKKALNPKQYPTKTPNQGPQTEEKWTLTHMPNHHCHQLLLALKNILDSNNIQYNKFTITQAGDLKEKLIEMMLKEKFNVSFIKYWENVPISEILNHKKDNHILYLWPPS